MIEWIVILIAIIVLIILGDNIKPRIDFLLVELQERPVEATKELVFFLILFVILCSIPFLISKYKKYCGKKKSNNNG